MRPITLIIALFVSIVTIAASLAYVSYPMFGYGGGYSYYGSVNGNSYYGPYGYVDGYRLTAFSPIGYGPSTVYAQDSSYRGAYSHYTGLYYDQNTGWPMPQYDPYYGGIPVRYYPQLNTVHYE